MYGLARLHTNLHNYKLNSLIAYFLVLSLSVSTIPYEVAFLPVSATLPYPRRLRLEVFVAPTMHSEI